MNNYSHTIILFFNKTKSKIGMVCLLLFTLTACIEQPTPTGKLNDTGITTCGDYNELSNSDLHNNDLDCAGTDPDGDPIPLGQDAISGRDADINTNTDIDGHKGFSFIKLDSYGRRLSDQTSTTFSCVKDNITGLIWEVKTTHGLHNNTDVHTWYNPDETTNGGNAGLINHRTRCFGYDENDVRTYCNTDAYISRVNDEKLCGAANWELPSREELRSLVNYGSFELTSRVDTNYFPNTKGIYWTSSIHAQFHTPRRSKIWAVGSSGSDVADPADDNFQIRLVRRKPIFPFNIPIVDVPNRQLNFQCENENPTIAASTAHLYDNQNGTISDSRTGLMWKKCSEGQNWSNENNNCEGEARAYDSWQEALQQTEYINLNGELGKHDWRLPNIKELSSIAELRCYQPAINQAVFPNTPSVGFIRYWSSSPNVSLPHTHSAFTVWKVDFYSGSVGTIGKKITGGIQFFPYIRLVREAVAN